MNTVNRTYRLDDVAETIRKEGFISSPDLAYIFGVSVRTINRDVKRIKQEFPQVYSKVGCNDGIGWIEEDKK